MKKFFLFIFILCSIVNVFSEEPDLGEYVITLTNEHVKTLEHDLCRYSDSEEANYIKVYLYKANGEIEERHNFNRSNGLPKTVNAFKNGLLSFEKTFNLNSSPYTQMKIQSRRSINMQYLFYYDCDEKAKAEIIINLLYPYQSENYNLTAGGGYDSPSTLKVQPKVINLAYYGINNVKTTDDYSLPSDDRITIKAPSGFPASVYNWMYKVNGVVKSIPGEFGNGTNTITIKGTDLFDYATILNYAANQTKIYIYIKSLRSIDTEFDQLELTSKLSTPTISSTKITYPSCYEKNDGTIEFTLRRPLYSGETLNIYEISDDGVTKVYLKTITSGNKISVKGVGNTSKLTGTKKSYSYSLSGTYGYDTYNSGEGHEIEVKINKPTRFTWYFTHPSLIPEQYRSNFVSCNGGSDGKLPSIYPTTGTSPYSYSFKHEEDLEWTDNLTSFNNITNIKAGIYSMKIQDKNLCGQSKDSIDYQILEPAPIKMYLIEDSTENLTGFETQDGKIQAQIVKPATGRTYKYVWQNSQGNIIPSIENISDVNYVYSTISNLSAGEYKLFVSVDTWNNIRPIPDFSTPNGCGCIDTLDVIITQPDPIIINIDTLQQVKCTGGSDGELVAHVTGGVKPYTYAWYQDDVLQDLTDSIITGAVGNYKMVLTDANGITKEAIAYLPQIDSLKIDSLHITDVYCAGNETGRIEAFVSGGTLGYKYFWSNNDAVTSVIENLQGGTYTLSVEDANACSASISATVNASNYITYGLTTEDLTCYHSNDGSIEINNIEGGNPPYLIKWEDDYTGLLRENMSAGNYYIEIEDSKNCIEPINVTLSEPDSIILNIPKQSYVLCKGQDLELNIAIEDDAASYNWYKENILMAETPSITISEKGNYRAQVFDVNACRGDAAFTVDTTDNEIFADFLVAGVVAKNDEVHVINITNPSAEKMEWILPLTSDIQVNRNDSLFLDVIFARCDSFDISLKSSQWGCEKITTKKIIVVEQSEMSDYKEGDTAFIEKFFVAPNPNDGNFDAVVELGEQMDIALILYDVSKAKTIETRYLKGSEYYKESFQLSLVSGTYLLRLITPNPQIYSTLKITIK